MENIRCSDLARMIAKDFNIEIQYKEKSYSKHFEIKNGKKKIYGRYSSVIVDKQGNEFPYMLDRNKRNEEKLVDFDYLYSIEYKTLEEIIKESGVKLKTEPCKVCEGGGWYSQGTRTHYKDYYCEQ